MLTGTYSDRETDIQTKRNLKRKIVYTERKIKEGRKTSFVDIFYKTY